MTRQSYTLTELASLIDAEVHGDANCKIEGIASLKMAKPGYISFLGSVKYKKFLKDTQASAVLLSPEYVKDCAVNALVLKDVELGYLKLARCFDDAPDATPGIHPSAVISDNAKIAPTASIAAQCVIESDVEIGEHVIVGAGCVIGRGSTIGNHTRLYPNVVILHGVKLGERVVINSVTVIGSNSFAYHDRNGKVT